MARNNSSGEVLIPISAIVATTGYPGESVWRKLNKSDVHEDWDHAPFVTWGRARVLFDEITAAKEENDRQNALMRDAQEREIREAQEAANRRAAERQPQRGLIHGVRVSTPGDGPEPDWMRDGSEEAE